MEPFRAGLAGDGEGAAVLEAEREPEGSRATSGKGGCHEAGESKDSTHDPRVPEGGCHDGRKQDSTPLIQEGPEGLPRRGESKDSVHVIQGSPEGGIQQEKTKIPLRDPRVPGREPPRRGESKRFRSRDQRSQGPSLGSLSAQTRRKVALHGAVQML